jgi:hypothetical protein
MTLAEITHDLASIDRVVYRVDMLRHGVHGWMLGCGGPRQRAMLVSFPVSEPLPTDAEWAVTLEDIRARWEPSLTIAS